MIDLKDFLLRNNQIAESDDDESNRPKVLANRAQVWTNSQGIIKLYFRQQLIGALKRFYEENKPLDQTQIY